MSNFVGYALVLIVGGFIGVVVGSVGVLLLRGKPKAVDKTEIRDMFSAVAQEALTQNSSAFIDRTKAELEPLHENLDKLDQQVRELEVKREGAYQGLQEQLRQLSEAQSNLHQTAIELSQAMRDTRARGQWGELQLRRVVELAGMMEHVDFDEQTSTGDGRPDMIVHLPNGGVLPVDAKAPMNAYLDAVSATEEEKRRACLDAHSRAMRGRIQDLSRKRYWQQFDEAPQFVVMFVPHEAGLSAAFQQDEALLDDALQSNILIASPVTLLALLKAVGYGWQQILLADNARKIAEEGKTLYERLAKIAEYIDSLGTNLQRTVDDFNSLVGSLEHRLLPSARRFEELGIKTSEFPAMETVEQTTREITADELRED